MNTKAILTGLLISSILASLPFGVYWLGGGDFTRSPGLAAAAFAGSIIFVGCITCPVWWD